MRPEITIATGQLRRNTPEAVEEAAGPLQSQEFLPM
jgi:hypothetical protein